MISFETFVGDVLSYSRCDKCNRTMWHHSNGSFMFYGGTATMQICNRCHPPIKGGRLYKESHVCNNLIPMNKEAYDFEVSRAGQVGALYKTRELVPFEELM